jgi:hypothetical protein
MDPGKLIGIFIYWPAAALLPAALFGFGWARRRRASLLVAALAWFAYAAYEQAMKWRILCSGECNIRIDLLLFYPILLGLSAAAVVAWCRRPRGNG